MSHAALHRRGRLVASAAALCVLVAGCGGPGEGPAAVPAPAVASDSARPPAPSPTPTPTPSETASAAEDWSREEAVEEYFAEGGQTATPQSRSESSASAASSPSPEELEAAAEPEASASADEPASSPSPAESTEAAPEPAVMPESTPVRVRVERAGIDSPLMELGLQEDGTVEVPPTGEGSPAGWYRNSPTPGERGPAVLLGHVGNAHGRLGVFGRLEELEPGDVVEVDREDGTTAVFTVDRSVPYDRSEFPKDEVYGNTEDAQLRLITCEDYSAWTGRWEANHVVYARLTG